MMHLLLLLAPLAQDLPLEPERSSPGEGAEELSVLPGLNLGGALGLEAEEPALLPELVLELVEPRPWEAPGSDEQRRGQLGPWPDGFEPQVRRLDMLPTVDPVTGRILDSGQPMEGELQGPQEPAPAPFVEEPPLQPADLPDMLETPPEEPTPVEPEPPAVTVAPPSVQVTPQASLWPFEPPAGGQSFTRSALWFFIATLAVLFGRWMDGTRNSLPKRGLLPAVARVIKIVCRVAALIAVLFGTMRLVPDAYFQYFPVVLVAASVAVGWSARDVLHDLLAGILLVVEHRLVPEMRVEADGRVGTVISVGFRSVSMESDDGQVIRIPNRDFLSTDTRVDKDPYAPVEVVVEAPHGARRRLQEIALASPLVAPGHAPEVFRDPEHPERWVVRARLVHPRWALAFRGAVQDRLEAG